jgi:hypothetical protein
LIPGHAGFVPSPGLSSLVEDFDGQLVLNALLADEGCVGINDSGSVFDVELSFLIAEDDVVVQFSVDALKRRDRQVVKDYFKMNAGSSARYSRF